MIKGINIILEILQKNNIQNLNGYYTISGLKNLFKLDTEEKPQPTGYYQKPRVTHFYDDFVLNRKLVFQNNISAKKPHNAKPKTVVCYAY